MWTLFLFCAVLGGTVMVFQIVLTLVGIDADSGGVDISDDVSQIGDVELQAGDADLHPDSTAAFRVISVRTVIAGVTFFGLGGLGAESTGAGPLAVWAVALAAGAAALYGVYWMFRSLYSMKSDGTVHIANAIGRHGNVYLRIPGNDSGAGKIQINLQSRTMEYLATTSGDALPTGTKVVVVDVLTPTTVQVEPVLEPERSNHV